VILVLLLLLQELNCFIMLLFAVTYIHGLLNKNGGTSTGVRGKNNKSIILDAHCYINAVFLTA